MLEGTSRHTTSPLTTPAGQVAGDAVRGPVPLGECEPRAPLGTRRLHVRLDVPVDLRRLPQHRHHGLVTVRGDQRWHGGRRWYQGGQGRSPRALLCSWRAGGPLRRRRGRPDALRPRPCPPAADITAVVNVGDDMEMHGLYISPDLDTVTYTLAGMDNTETGWGVAGETWAVMDELGRLGGEDWFRLGDRDLATHLFRTGRLRAGEPLSAVTAELGDRRGVAVRLLPVTDDPLRTRVILAQAVRLGPPGTEVASRTTSCGSATTWRSAACASTAPRRPARRPGVIEAIDAADAIVVCPSNPVVSIGPLLRRARPAGGPGGAPGAVVGGLPHRRRRRTQGSRRPPHGRARNGSVRRRRRPALRTWAGTLVVDVADAAHARAVEAEGMRCVVHPLS